VHRSGETEALRMPRGFRIEFDMDGWRHRRGTKRSVSLGSWSIRLESVVEADTTDDAHDFALAHPRAKGDKYEWKNPRSDLTVWHKAEIDNPAFVDVTV
jgi:hypothetical protein